MPNWRPQVCHCSFSFSRAPGHSPGRCRVFVAASHQTRLDTRSKARRPIKVGIKGRGRSGRSRDSNPACLCCSSAHLVQCEPDEASSFTNPNVSPGTYASLRLKLDAWSSAVQRGQKCSSPTRRLPSPKAGGLVGPESALGFEAPKSGTNVPDGPAKKPGRCRVFVAASHQTRLDTRSKARRPIKVGIKGRGRSGRSRDSNPACLCCSSAHLVQCEPDEASSFTNPNVGPGTYASLRLKLDAWSSAVQGGQRRQKCSSPTEGCLVETRCLIKGPKSAIAPFPGPLECQNRPRKAGALPIFVAASHQTRLDTRSKARRPIKVGIKGRGRSGRSRDSNPACLCCSSAHLVQCEPDEASSFTNPNVGPGTYASLRLKLDAWSSAVQGGTKETKMQLSPPEGSLVETRCLIKGPKSAIVPFPGPRSGPKSRTGPGAFAGALPIFVAASHQTRLDTRSKARRPIKVGIKGRGRSGRSRDSNPACLCCSSAHLVQCEPDEASSFHEPKCGSGHVCQFAA